MPAPAGPPYPGGVRRPRELDRHRVADVAVAAAVLAGQVAILTIDNKDWPDLGALGVALAVLTPLALLARRRYPVAVALVTGAAVLAMPACVPSLVAALYAVGAYAGAPAAPLVWAVVASSLLTVHTVDDRLDGALRGGLFAVALHFPIVVGLQVRESRRKVARLVDRAERAEREQELLADAAVAAERARLARELHDVVAHRVSLMVLHASALELAPSPPTPTPAIAGPGAGAGDGTGTGNGAGPSGGRRPEADEAALIGAIGRQALDELRQMLDVLRPGTEEAPLAPLAGVADVHELAAGSRAAGTAVTVTEDGDVASVPGSVGRAAFRVVQEGLTNAHKHAPGATVAVHLRRHAGRLDVEVANGPGDTPLDVPGGGHGLTGLRERAALLGGRLLAGPREDGGWLVRAELPAP